MLSQVLQVVPRTVSPSVTLHNELRETLCKNSLIDVKNTQGGGVGC